MARSTKTMLTALGMILVLLAFIIPLFGYPPPPEASAEGICGEDLQIEIVDEVPSSSIGEVEFCGEITLWCAPPIGNLYVCQTDLVGEPEPLPTTAPIPNPTPSEPLPTLSQGSASAVAPIPEFTG